MSFSPRFGMPLNPAHYAWDLVKQMGFRQPPICEEEVLSYVGLKRRYFPGSHFFPVADEHEEDCPDDAGQLPLFVGEQTRGRSGNQSRQNRTKRVVDAALLDNVVWVDGESSKERQRAAICHEVGHKVIPWHQDLSYLKNGCLLDSTPRGLLKHRQYEEEANCFSSHVLMPAPFFLEDMNSLAFGVAAVETLARRYITSIESTAIHYVSLASRACALVMIEALPENLADGRDCFLRVRYSKASRSFRHFVRPGAEIPKDSIIAWTSSLGPGDVHTDRVSGSILGLRPDRRLIVHCRPWGKGGDVLVLVQEPSGNQGTLF